MIINAQSIKVNCCDFSELALELSVDLGAWLTGTFFEFEDSSANEDPTSADLQTLFRTVDSPPCDSLCKQKDHYPNYGPMCIEGDLWLDSWRNIQEYINEHLSTDDTPKSEADMPRCNRIGYLPAAPEIVERRVKFYWDSVGKFLQLPPTRAYWFENTTGAFFGDFCTWGFTIVLINDKQKAGIVLDGGNMD